MNTIKTMSGSLFTSAFEKAIAIDYNEAWSNGTGYYDLATKRSMNSIVEEGKIYKTTSTKGRRLLLVGTCFGPVVVFDRFTGQAEGVFVYNCPEDLRMFFTEDGAITLQTMQEILGCMDCFEQVNIGMKLKRLRGKFRFLEQEAKKEANA